MPKKSEDNSSFPYLIFVFIALLISYFLTTKFYGLYISFPIIWWVDYGGYVRPYLEDSSLLLGFASIISCMIIIQIIRDSNNGPLKFRLGVWSIIIAILFHWLWWIINPMYRFEEHPSTYWYMDSKKEYIEDTDKYLKLIERFWDKYSSHFRPFKTLDDHIKVIDYTIKSNHRTVWGLSIESAWKIYWYDKLFEKYKDKTAETDYLIEVFGYSRQNEGNWLYDSYEGFYYLKDHWSTENIREASRFLYEWFEANKNKPEIDFFRTKDHYIDKAYDLYYKKLMSERLNFRMINWYDNRWNKFILDQDWGYYMIEGYYLKN